VSTFRIPEGDPKRGAAMSPGILFSMKRALRTSGPSLVAESSPSTPGPRSSRAADSIGFAHYSKAVRRGARVNATRGSLSTIDHVAFVNPDGDYVLVLTNQAEEREIGCRFEGKSLHLKMPWISIVTLPWS